MKELNAERGKEDLIVKIGIHEEPCLAGDAERAAGLFRQTVNIAARVQSLSTSQEIHLTQPVMESAEVAGILDRAAIKPIRRKPRSWYRRQARGVRMP